jgi:hypothetical protein
MHTIIKTDKRYLNQIEEFNNTLPAGILNKKTTNCGGTTVALTNPEKYILAVPTINLIDNKMQLKNGVSPNLCAIYGDVAHKSVVVSEYLANMHLELAPKFITTYDSLPTLLTLLGEDASQYNLLVDEYHHLFMSCGFRMKAIRKLFRVADRVKKVTYMSASPIDEDFLPKELASLPYTTIEWENQKTYTIDTIKSYHPIKSAVTIINQLLAGTYEFEGKKVDELFIFLNSVNSIRQIIKTCGLTDENTKVVCARTEVNAIKLQGVKLSKAEGDNKKINILTSTAFAGVDLYSKAGLIVIVSDQKSKQTLLDVKTHIYQILGRIRNDDNLFQCNAIHIYQPQASAKKNNTTKQWEELDIDKAFSDFISLIDRTASATKILVGTNNAYNKNTQEVMARLVSNSESDILNFMYYDKDEEVFEYLDLKESYARYAAKVEWHTYKNGLNLVSEYKCMGIALNNDVYDSKAKEVELLTVTTVDFKVLCERYIELREANDFIAAGKLASNYPLIKEAYDVLGASSIKTLKTRAKIQLAVVMKSPAFKKFIQSELPNYFSLNERYTASDVKAKLESIYSLVGINTTVKANDLLSFTDKAKEGRKASRYYTITDWDIKVKDNTPIIQELTDLLA